MFSHKRITTGDYRIRGAGGMISYLVVGEERAFLLDTGLGVGSLRGYVETLTDKPVTVLLSHGHMDHAMGAWEFDEIYMNPADEGAYVQHLDPEYRTWSTRRFLGEGYARWKDWMTPSEHFDYRPLLPGVTIDLGGRRIQTLDGAGHTMGCLCFLLPEDRVLILGDACERNTMLIDEYSLDVRQYREHMLALEEKTRGLYDQCWFFHGHGEDRPGYIESVIGVCDTVLAGGSAQIPYTFMDKSLLVALPRDAHLRRLDGGLADLAYAPGKER
ncbi:MAG: MBL fold metallo-hydrolase [Oscillospiraceae bacterium]|nr:MBL fold metallo-hydrolase [Oscillospiraceae bacterium]